jgi:hypothetical protein
MSNSVRQVIYTWDDNKTVKFDPIDKDYFCCDEKNGEMHGEEGFICEICNRLFEVCENCNVIYDDLVVRLIRSCVDEFQIHGDLVEDKDFDHSNFWEVDQEDEGFFRIYSKERSDRVVQVMTEIVNNVYLFDLKIITHLIVPYLPSMNHVQCKEYLPDGGVSYMWYCGKCGQWTITNPD